MGFGGYIYNLYGSNISSTNWQVEEYKQVKYGSISRHMGVWLGFTSFHRLVQIWNQKIKIKATDIFKFWKQTYLEKTETKTFSFDFKRIELVGLLSGYLSQTPTPTLSFKSLSFCDKKIIKNKK